MASQLVPVLLLAVIVVLFGGGLLFLTSLLGPKEKQSKEKLQPYECGVISTGVRSSKIPIKYYLTAISFILFDIEIVFLYPWAIIYSKEASSAGLYLLGVMGFFFLLVVLGLFYEIRSRRTRVGLDIVEILINFVKIIGIFLMMIQMVPLLVWVERRGSALIQHRLGPNRVGPLGLMQLLADAVKFIWKEEFVPGQAVKFLFYAAPVIALIPAALAFTAIPLAAPLHVDAFTLAGKTWGPYTIALQGTDMTVGLLYVLGVSSLGTYALLIAGWASGSKYSLLGALRASAQAVSYELSLGMSLVGAVILYSTFNFTEMVNFQQGPLHFNFFGREFLLPFLPNWGVFYQPLGAILFFICAFAESNRLPFDMAEAEGELVAGFHTEYGGFKMLLFFMGEYGHMMVASALLSTVYFGGYLVPGWSIEQITQWAHTITDGTLASALVTAVLLLSFSLKVGFFLWVFVWVRWTLPRFRYDQLMDLGWKTLLPWAMLNAVVTVLVIFFSQMKAGG